MTFRMIVQLWNTNTPVIVSRDADQTENYMYISMKFRTGVHVFCWEVGVFNRSCFQSVSCNISRLLIFPRCCTTVLCFNSKNLQITSKLLTQGNRYQKLRKHLESSSVHTVSFYPNLAIYLFKNMFLQESLTRFSTVNKKGQMWSEFRLVGLEKKLNAFESMTQWSSNGR